MQITIRPFAGSDDDYEILTTIRNAVYPDYAYTQAEWRRVDERRDPKCLFVRVVAEADGKAVGLGHYGNISWIFHPQKFELRVFVHPEYQGKGIGSQIYTHLTNELAAHNPLVLRHQLREDYVASMAFAQQRGFVEEIRAWESRLDVASFDVAPYAGQAAKLVAHGIAIKTAGELEASDPEFWPKLYALDILLGQDVPSPDTFTPPAYESWIKWFKDAPNFLPNAFFIAVDGAEYVGLSGLWQREGSSELDTGLTGVRREYRRRGIALALKLRAIAYAKEHGAAVIRTHNESNNRAMLSINEALGFVKLPAWVGLVKHL